MKKNFYPQRLMPSPNHKLMALGDRFEDYYVLNYMKEDKPFVSLEAAKADIDNQMAGKRFLSGFSVSLAVNYNEGEHLKRVLKNKQRDYFGDWHEGEKVLKPLEEDVMVIDNRGWFGFKMKDVESVKANFSITNKKQVVVRTDETRLKVEHRPSNCNFWHCNLEVYGTHETTQEQYKAANRDVSKYSPKMIENAGAQLVRILKDKIIAPEDIEYKHVHAREFMKEMTDKKEFKRFRKG